VNKVRIIVGATLLAIAVVGHAPFGGASVTDISQTSSNTQGIHFMPILTPVDAKEILAVATGSSQASAGSLIYGGGAIEKQADLYVCWWGWTSDPYGEQSYYTNFMNGVGGTSWLNSQTQYYSNAQGFITNPTGILKGEWSDSSSVPSKPTQTQVNNEGIKCEQHFGYDANGDYVVATPSGHSQSGFGTRWCAYHEGLTSSGKNVAVTYLPYIHDAGTSCGLDFVNSGSAGTLDGVSIVGGHEMAEALTDPAPCTGWCTSGGSETGDLCAWSSLSGDISESTGTFAVQPLYSDSAGGCVMSG
jgi:serine protease